MTPAARLFVAAELPDQVRAALAAWGAHAAREDPALRPLNEDALHITLHFLGYRPEDELGGLCAAVRAAGEQVTAPLTLSVDGALWLAPRRPHVLTCALTDATGGLGEVHRALSGPLAAIAAGWSTEGRALRPHVTVARVRRGTRPQPGEEPSPPGAEFAATALTLFRSHLSPKGARYEPLERVTLPS